MLPSLSVRVYSRSNSGRGARMGSSTRRTRPPSRPGSAEVGVSSVSGLRGLVATLRAGLVYWLALPLALAIAATAPNLSQNARMANHDLTADAIPDTYLMLSKRDEARGYIADRRNSTVRRNRKNYPGRSWRVTRFGRDCWLLRSKRQGTVFFVPVEEVADWIFPFFYDFVRLEAAPELPLVTWNQLLVNRIYTGLYLRIELPFDPRKKDGGNGILREILSVDRDRLTAVDTRFDRNGRLYVDLIAQGTFPRLQQPTAALGWLARQRPAEETTFLLHNAEPFDVTLLPLPLPINALARGVYGEPLLPIRDDRYQRWTAGGWRRMDDNPFDAATRGRLEDAFHEYVANFRIALRSHRVLHDGSPEIGNWPPRTLEEVLPEAPR